MKAEDTILALDTRFGKRNPDLEKIQQGQAEYSFKAGIREVVEWINKNNALAHASLKGHNPIGSYADDCWVCKEWQAQQEEWGVTASKTEVVLDEAYHYIQQHRKQHKDEK